MKTYMGVSDEGETEGSWDAVSLSKRMFIGGCAGMAAWAVGYPFDVIKTEIQTTNDQKLNMRRAIIKGHK